MFFVNVLGIAVSIYVTAQEKRLYLPFIYDTPFRKYAWSNNFHSKFKIILPVEGFAVFDESRVDHSADDFRVVVRVSIKGLKVW